MSKREAVIVVCKSPWEIWRRPARPWVGARDYCEQCLEAADLFLKRDNGHLRTLLNPFQTYMTGLRKVRVEPLLSVQYRYSDLGLEYDLSARFVMNQIPRC